MDLALRAVALVAALAVAACGHFAVADDGRNRPAKPQVVVISLDGAKPDLVESFLASGVLDSSTASHNDISLNTFHPVAAAISTSAWRRRPPSTAW